MTTLRAVLRVPSARVAVLVLDGAKPLDVGIPAQVGLQRDLQAEAAGVVGADAHVGGDRGLAHVDLLGRRAELEGAVEARGVAGGEELLRVVPRPAGPAGIIATPQGNVALAWICAKL